MYLGTGGRVSKSSLVCAAVWDMCGIVHCRMVWHGVCAHVWYGGTRCARLTIRVLDKHCTRTTATLPAGDLDTLQAADARRELVSEAR